MSQVNDGDDSEYEDADEDADEDDGADDADVGQTRGGRRRARRCTRPIHKIPSVELGRVRDKPEFVTHTAFPRLFQRVPTFTASDGRKRSVKRSTRLSDADFELWLSDIFIPAYKEVL